MRLKLSCAPENMHFYPPYGESLALLTDLYQLTMAYSYWKKGIADRKAVFHHFYRKAPFGGSFVIAAGLDNLATFIEKFRFDSSDLAYLATLQDSAGDPLFEQPFLDYLGNLKLTLDIDGVKEGTPVFPKQPFLRVTGPILQAQLIESALLNIINFQSLIATKAERICRMANGDSVVEFGMRRAQGPDGAISAARAAIIGGCSATSHVLAGKLLGVPVKGTHAHSWVMAFDDEEKAFDAWAECMPNNCIFLIDTYNTLEGVKKAIRSGQKLRQKGHEMIGVRLDSGDLAYLSKECRKMLDAAGFENAKIMASNELDEYLIKDLKQQGAEITLWGVGTNLVTGKEQPALDGVYKLSALQNENGEWVDKIKVSDQIEKTTNPGHLQVRRYIKDGKCIGDMLYDIRRKVDGEVIAVEKSREYPFSQTHEYEDLLNPIFKNGKRLLENQNLMEIQTYVRDQIDRFDPRVIRFMNPQTYLNGMEKSLFQEKMEQIQENR